MSGHTDMPLCLGPESRFGGRHIYAGLTGRSVAIAEVTETRLGENDANAERLVACWNAFQGFPQNLIMAETVAEICERRATALSRARVEELEQHNAVLRAYAKTQQATINALQDTLRKLAGNTQCEHVWEHEEAMEYQFGTMAETWRCTVCGSCTTENPHADT